MLHHTSPNKSKLTFATKVETLQKVSAVLESAHVLPIFSFTVNDWRTSRENIFNAFSKLDWSKQPLIIRSSAQNEDSEGASFAGRYTSVMTTPGLDNFTTGVTTVIDSYDENPEHQVFIQPQLQQVKLSGVAFGRDPNTDGPYIIINYDDHSGDTTTITSGASNHKSYVQHYACPNTAPDHLVNVISLVKELQSLFEMDSIDIEFAIDQNNSIYLFQVRPLITKIKGGLSTEAHRVAHERIFQKVQLGLQPHPYLYGNRTVYGVMPDWNPAEIIGIRPKPLAISLYRELVTNHVWAYQRDNYGYANLRSFPLLVDFEGLPYIDVRVSFNSFIPKILPPELANRLVNYYLQQLIENPSLHDKVEFDIVFSCYTLDLRKRLTVLTEHGFTEKEQEQIFQALTNLTNDIMHNDIGLWKKDLEKIEELTKRQDLLFKSYLDPVSKMYWILEDCKRYGTLPFAGLARAGFIAIQILKSFISANIISEKEYTDFLLSVNSVGSKMTLDFNTLNRSDFLSAYGHLRPGTYDVTCPRYDESPDTYFDWSKSKTDTSNGTNKHVFSLNLAQLRQIQEYIDKDRLQVSVLDLLEFIKSSIESREYSKFVFTRSVSEFLKICTEFASHYGISREDCAFLDLTVLLSLYSSSIDPEEALKKCITVGKYRHHITSTITIPPLITNPDQVWAYEFPQTLPNFITQSSASGNVAFADRNEPLTNAIVFITSADPGYDWIFSHNIAGFVTKYGGVNSHMAIRAGELGIPAIIGAGEVKYQQWSSLKYIHLDCLNKQVLNV